MKDYKEFKNVTFINPITTTIEDDVVIGEEYYTSWLLFKR